MDWDKYTKDFSISALDNGFDEQYINRCLHYAEKINEKNLPVIYSLDHLALLIGIDESYFRFAIYKMDGFYRSFEILKKSGGVRKIDEPLPNLKIIQRWILENILYKINVSPYAKGFVPGRSIRENARFHRDQDMVLTIDIKNFFPSLSIIHVTSIFKSFGYSQRISFVLAKLCTLNGTLPQGASTSPALSNLIFLPLDKRIAEYCRKREIRYTRYADDLTFSGNFFDGSLIRFVRSVLSSLRLTINDSKTRLMKRHERQEVTGVVVNKKLQAPIEIRRNLRQAIFYIEKYGLDNHLMKINENRANYVSHLLGCATFILFLNPNDACAINAKKFLLKLKLNYFE